MITYVISKIIPKLLTFFIFKTIVKCPQDIEQSVKCPLDIEQSVKCPLDIKEGVESEILPEQIIPKEITKSCVSCTSPDTAEMIQCNSCNKWINYTCSMLPPYQVYIFVTSSRRYSCPNCVQIQDSFKYKSLSMHPTNTSINNHVDNGTIPLTKESSCQTNEHLKFDDKKNAGGCCMPNWSC